MRRYHVLIAAFAVCALAGSAFGWGRMMGGFACPSGSQYPRGLGYRNNNLYVATDSPDRCFQTTLAGSVVRSHTLVGDSTKGCAAGVINSVGYYWYIRHRTYPALCRIYQVVATTGSVVRYFGAPDAGADGLAFMHSGSSDFLFCTSHTERRLYWLVATTGSVLQSRSLSFAPSDLGYGDGYLWVVDTGNQRLRKCSILGVHYDSFSVSSYGFPMGCTYDAGRDRVWISFNHPINYVRQFEVSSGSAVVPSSAGKIKALFR